MPRYAIRPRDSTASWNRSTDWNGRCDSREDADNVVYRKLDPQLYETMTAIW